MFRDVSARVKRAITRTIFERANKKRRPSTLASSFIVHTSCRLRDRLLHFDPLNQSASCLSPIGVHVSASVNQSSHLLRAADRLVTDARNRSPPSSRHTSRQPRAKAQTHDTSRDLPAQIALHHQDQWDSNPWPPPDVDNVVATISYTLRMTVAANRFKDRRRRRVPNPPHRFA